MTEVATGTWIDLADSSGGIDPMDRIGGATWWRLTFERVDGERSAWEWDGETGDDE